MCRHFGGGGGLTRILSEDLSSRSINILEGDGRDGKVWPDIWLRWCSVLCICVPGYPYVHGVGMCKRMEMNRSRMQETGNIKCC